MRFHVLLARSLGLWLFAAPSLAQGLPAWLVEAQAREAPLGQPVEVASEDGVLRTRVPGTVGHKVVLDGGGYSLTIGVGDQFTVHCDVLTEAQDLAALLVRSAEISFGGIAKLNGTVEAKALEASDAGSAGAHPFLSLQWLYRADQQGEKRVGALKQYVAQVGDAVVYCGNDALGHVKTFEAVTRMLTENLRIAAKPALQTYFHEVIVFTLDGARVGVALNRLAKDSDGDTRASTTSALVLQTAPGQLVAQDTYDIQWVRPDGSLINASQAKASQGKVTEDMALQRGDNGRWRASGTISGKAVDAELSGTPSSAVQLMQARRQLMARADPVGASSDAPIWSSVDLTRLLAARATVLAPDGPDRFAVREELGGLVIDAVLDRQTGTMVSGRIPLGPRVMTLERVHVQGGF